MTAGIHRFAAFELDRDGRALRLDGREIPLQPRVFDLLLYLVENRERVVSKEELLDTLWPGVIVTEGSLQRAVSLARAALQQGGLGEALRNYARRGYRFLVDEPPPATAADAQDGDALAEAECAFAAGRWRAAMAAFASADRATPLSAECLERWAAAAQCAGELAAAAPPLERAAVAYSSRSEPEAAARVTIGLARIQIESLDVAVTQGCLRRARRLLSGLPRGAQHGFLAWMSARLHLYNGDLAEAIRCAIEARDIGRELQNADIESMGLLIWGIGLQARGDTPAGMALQDEAAAAVLAGDVSPLVGGIVYCGVISSCCNSEDWRRAEQWTDSFTRWCERCHIDTFAGACLIHRAEVFAMSGRLALAHDAIARADPLIRAGAPWALGDAYRLLGDVLFARGEEDAAEQSYLHAYQHGWDPYPGYAILLHQRGRSDEAVRGLKRAATLTNWVAGERRGRYLAHACQIASLAGALDEARALLEALDRAPAMWASGAAAAQVDRARAELAWATAEQDEALRLFARAADVLRHQRAVMDAALLRLRLAEALAACGEHGAAAMELAAAEAVFESAGAGGYLSRCRALRAAVSGGGG
ncbi:LuxR family transcriptional regulator [Plasticicumulans lactativorans]|uniref:LuxR family transcriptional regulator n=1 Tax=Plasticicumulans lactativorans TaxID=1133106 RepID=A0A4R2LI05_9GAMM|nr:winged helix-turn-helix domain-containing protein [Plasticicumulans lactativorans]TCO82771.1 LuxR family transcriptional regulator [Plasticicumulans lactativorans]